MSRWEDLGYRGGSFLSFLGVRGVGEPHGLGSGLAGIRVDGAADRVRRVTRQRVLPRFSDNVAGSLGKAIACQCAGVTYIGHLVDRIRVRHMRTNDGMTAPSRRN